MTDEQRKAIIDGASYEQLLQIWRFEPIGSPWHCGEVGQYLSNRFYELRETMTSGELVSASKAVGWD